MNRFTLVLCLLVIVTCAFIAGFSAAMIIAGHTDWECWGYGTNC